MRRCRDQKNSTKESKEKLKYQQNYFEEVSKNVELSKYKQQSRLYDDIHFFSEQENYNPLQWENYNSYYYHFDEDDEEQVIEQRIGSDSSLDSYQMRKQGISRSRSSENRSQSRSRSNSSRSSSRNPRYRNSSSEGSIKRQRETNEKKIYDIEISSEGEIVNEDERIQKKKDNPNDNCKDYELLNKQNDFFEIKESKPANQQLNNGNHQLINEENVQRNVQQQKEKSSKKKQNKEDIQIENLKQKINFYQFTKQQYLDILQYFKQEETNQMQFETQDSQISQENMLDQDDFKYKAIIFMNKIFNQSFKQLNLEYQVNNIRCTSGLEEGDQNNLIDRASQMDQFFSRQEIDALNYFEFSENTIFKPEQFKSNLQEKLSNEKRLNFINFTLGRKLDKKLIQSIDQNELLLDLIPSTIDTKVIILKLSIDNMLSILLAANCIASTFNFNLVIIQGIDYFRNHRKQDTSIYQNYLQLLFDSIIQQRAIQSLSIQDIPLFSKPLIRSLKNIDLGFTYIQNLSINNQICEEEQLDFLNILAQLPYLSSLDCQDFILDTTEKVKALNNVLKKLISAQIKIDYLPKNFNFEFQFEKLKHLQISLGIQKQQLTNRKLDNFFKSLSQSQNLKVLDVNFQQSYYQKQNKSKKKLQNRANRDQDDDNEEDFDDGASAGEYDEQYDNYDEDDCQEYIEEDNNDESSSIQSDQDDSNEEEIEVEEVVNEEDKILEDDKNGKKNNQPLQLLNHLNNLMQLQDLHLNLELSQLLVDNLLEFLQKNKILKKFTLKSNENFTYNQYYQVFLQEFKQIQSARVDFKNVLEIISCQQNLEQVNLILQNYNIQYRKCNKDENCSKIYLQQQQQPLYKDGFNLNSFKLNNLIQITYNSKNQSGNCHEQLNDLLSSLQISENIQKINISINDAYNTYQSKSQQKPFEKTGEQYLLFQNLKNLRSLNYLQLTIKFDEILINSLSELILTNKNIREINLQGCQSNACLEQNFKGYGNLIRSLSSSCLQSASLKFILQYNSYYFLQNLEQKVQEEFKKKHLKEIENEILHPLLDLIENKNRKLKKLTFFEKLDNELHSELILSSLLKDIQPLKIEFNDDMRRIFNKSEKLKDLYQQCQDKNVV
ncbi:hypothetical protein ABPG74_000920 [Tetrahymena malaccensis]